MSEVGRQRTEVPPKPTNLRVKLRRVERLRRGRQRSDVTGRFHCELQRARVTAFNASLLQFEILARVRCLRGWDKIIARNEWFQRRVVNYLSSYQLSVIGSQVIVFAYSYVAREIFRFAKARGWKTVLGQIDPGPREEEIVQAEVAANKSLDPLWEPAPNEYWENWHEECELADTIIVNSEWSRTCLAKAGVNGSKLSVIPLAYESPITDTPITRAYPAHFSRDRPLRVLFLGQFNLRKGAARLLAAASELTSLPVEFWIVGPVQFAIATQRSFPPNVRCFGRARNADVGRYYRSADVFILPTLSDGFALTQLEALYYRLPIITSRFCGNVVQDSIDGILLPEPTTAAIVSAVQKLDENPGLLDRMSAVAELRHEFTIDGLKEHLRSLVA